MNAEALAGCILHGCMSRVVREIQSQRELITQKVPGAPWGWISDQRAE